MPQTITGPIATIPDRFGQSVPFYALRYDKNGNLLSPDSLDHLLAYVNNAGVSDILFYSHGWNNDFPTARKRYEEFLSGVSEAAKTHAGMLPSRFKPVFVGVIWPSTILVWPWDKGPDIAALPTSESFEEILGMLSPALRARIEAALATGGLVPPDDAQLLAQELADALPTPEEDENNTNPYSAEDLLEAWKVLAVPDGDTPGDLGGFDDFGDFGGGAAAETPAVAGLFGFDPRVILRAPTVLMMKDRAGVVGARGVARTLRRLLDDTTARLHLLGHSYGAKVVSTALVRADAQRKAQSLTLFQAAINHQAFSPNVNGKPGAFRPALSKVVRPVMATFSSNDMALHKVFHLICRRASDLGEAQIAGAVSKFAALGGYGPQTLAQGEAATMPIPASGAAYGQQPAAVRMLGLNGSKGIAGHSDVNNAWTWWAALNQLR